MANGDPPLEDRAIPRAHDASDDGAHLIWPFGITVTPKQDPITIVLTKAGARRGGFPILTFEIRDGPPDYNFDLQLVRSDPNLLTGNPGGPPAAWKPGQTRRERTAATFFSSWGAGERKKLDANGNADYTMPLAWWRDTAALELTQWTDWDADPRDPHLLMHYRVIAFDDADADRVYSTTDADCASAPSVRVLNNLLRFRVHQLRYYREGATDVWRRYARMTHYVREAHTTDMYCMVQWKRGGRTNDAGDIVCTVTDYDQAHASTYPNWQIDRIHTNPRYHDGNTTIAGDGLSAYFYDAVSCSPLGPGDAPWLAVAPSAGDACRTVIDFTSNLHLDADVPAAVTIDNAAGTTMADGTRGVYRGIIDNHSGRPLRKISWAARMRVWQDATGAHFQQL